jgi:hypothetical protein
MEIKKVNAAVSGALNLEVEFDDEEHAFLIEFAINHLIAAGASPFLVDYETPTEDNTTADGFYVPGSRIIN